MFLESCSLYILTRKQNYFLYVVHCQFSLGQSPLSRPALLLHLHSCPCGAHPVNQEVLSVTTLCRTETLYGQHECTQLIFQASRQMDLFSTNTLFPVEQLEDSKGCCWPRCISKGWVSNRHHNLRWLFTSRAGWESPGQKQLSGLQDSGEVNAVRREAADQA